MKRHLWITLINSISINAMKMGTNVGFMGTKGKG